MLTLLTHSQATGTQAPSRETAVGESCIVPSAGRGALSLLRVTQQIQVVKPDDAGGVSVEQITSSVAQFAVTESYPRPILEHQEKPPVVKKGEKGSK